jgi:DNA-directed RNA polymerase specialized sigma24 family protein
MERRGQVEPSVLVRHGNEPDLEQALMEEARRGHHGAWTMLVRRNRSALVGAATGQPRARWQEPEDLVQEALARAWRYRRSLRPEAGRFLPWVRTASLRAGLSAVKEEARLDGALRRADASRRERAGVARGESARSRPDRDLAVRLAERRTRGAVRSALRGLTALEDAVVRHWAEGGNSHDFRRPDGRGHTPVGYRQVLFRARGKLRAWRTSGARATQAGVTPGLFRR